VARDVIADSAPWSLRRKILDTWAPLTHKRTLDGGYEEAADQPSWLDLHDWRRLNAYMLRLAYQRNVARYYIRGTDGEDHREYGDPALFVQQVTAALLGREQTIVVDLADKHDPNRQPVTEGAEEGGQGEEVEPEPEGAAAAYERQQWLRAWADDERLPSKMLESERQTVGLGDSVYVLGWAASKRRPVLRVYDPGLYFPVIDDDDPSDYPSRVHMLWEIEGSPGQPNQLRRRTWEIGAIEPLTEQRVDMDTGVLRRFIALFRGRDDTVTTAPQPGDVQLSDGRYARSYPWQEEDDPPSTVTCYYTDATWRMDKLSAEWTYDNLPLSQATFRVTEDGQVADRLDLRIDFLPVVHVPNTVAGQEHFGASVIDPVAQVFDDISAADTDTAGAGALAGKPIISLSGVAAPNTGEQILEGGTIFGLGANGRMDALDMSGQLAALQQLRQELRDIASVNGRVPEALLGRIKPNEVPSGFALALGFTPFESLLGEMRLVRQEKYALLLKFVQRLGMAAGVLPAGPTLRAEMVFGAYLPANQAEAIDQAVKRYAAGLASLEQCLTELQAAGVPIDDVQAEAQAIRKRDYDRAEALYAATGDYTLVYEFLGLPKPAKDPRQPNPEPATGPDGEPLPEIDLNTAGPRG
jgi:hypothetical protein